MYLGCIIKLNAEHSRWHVCIVMKIVDHHVQENFDSVFYGPLHMHIKSSIHRLYHVALIPIIYVEHT